MSIQGQFQVVERLVEAVAQRQIKRSRLHVVLRGGEDAVSVMHTADPFRSDPDFAGLTLRCAETGTEVLVILLQTLSPRAKPQVVQAERDKLTAIEESLAKLRARRAELGR